MDRELATKNLGRVEGEGAREAFVQADAKLRQVNAHTLDLTQRAVDELNHSWWAIMKTIGDVQPVTAEGRQAKAHAGYLAAMYKATTRVSVPWIEQTSSCEQFIIKALAHALWRIYAPGTSGLRRHRARQ